MKDFKSYSQEAPKNGGSAENNANTGLNNGTNGSSGSNDTEVAAVEIAKILSRAMNGKSEEQILNAIIAEAERGKRAGTLTNADLDNFYNMLYPLLDGFKRKKLKEVITKLKQI